MIPSAKKKIKYFTVVVFGEERNDGRVMRDFLWQSYVSQGQSDDLVPLENTNSSAFMTFAFLCLKGILQIQVGVKVKCQPKHYWKIYFGSIYPSGR